MHTNYCVCFTVLKFFLFIFHSDLTKSCVCVQPPCYQYQFMIAKQEQYLPVKAEAMQKLKQQIPQIHIISNLKCVLCSCRSTEVDLSNYVQNGEWENMKIIIKRNVVYYACCVEPFPDVTIVVHIRRRMPYYLYNVIFPCIMSALTLLVFCLPPDSGENITMGITVLLAFSAFMLTVAEDLPETSEFIPLLSIY